MDCQRMALLRQHLAAALKCELSRPLPLVAGVSGVWR